MRLAKLRKGKKLSQKELSSIINVAQNTISQWEQGKRDPDTATLKKLADFFEVTTDYLLGRDEPQKEKSLPPDRERLFNKMSSIDDETAAELEQYLNYLNAKKDVRNGKTGTGK